MGTPDFSVPALRRLIAEHDVVCVYTREPKPSGRGNKLNKTPIHIVAEANNIEVRTPKTLRNIEEQQKFSDLKADIAIVAAYGLLLPKPILEAFPLGCLNIHASLLPRWRGAAPIQRCIEAGDKESGVTIMQMEEGLDTGDMLLKDKIAINDNMTGGELHDKMMELGADLISAVLKDIKAYPPQKQDDTLTCYAKKIDKSECLMNFKQSTDSLYNKIRAMSPFPGMYFEYEGERFKVLKCEKQADTYPCGKLFTKTGNLVVGTTDGAIKITEIQRQGKRPMSSEELLRGFSFNDDTQL